MGWADFAIKELLEGRNVVIRPKGNSMQPRIYSGAEVELHPVTDLSLLCTDQIVLVKVSGRIYLHLITAINKDQVQISNNKGHINGWTAKKNVYGVVVVVNNG